MAAINPQNVSFNRHEF